MTTPLTPADCDLRDFSYMPVDVVRLRDSDAAGGDPIAFRAAFLLWCASWHQVPAASLPDDDVALARLAGYGRDVRNWKRARERGALRDFVLCSDGRLYHPVVAEKAMEAWRSKQARQEKMATMRAAKASHAAHNPPTSPPEAQFQPDSNAAAQPVQTKSTAGAPQVDPLHSHTQAIENADSSPSSQEAIREKKGEEKKGKDIQGEGAQTHSLPLLSIVATDAPPPAPPNSRGTRMSSSWVPSPDDVRFAVNLGLNAEAVAEKFRDYWLAKSGKDGLKADWSATWRTWCRREEAEIATKPKPKLHTLPRAERDRRILQAAGAPEFVDPPPYVPPQRISQ